MEILLPTADPIGPPTQELARALGLAVPSLMAGRDLKTEPGTEGTPA